MVQIDECSASGVRIGTDHIRNQCVSSSKRRESEEIDTVRSLRDARVDHVPQDGLDMSRSRRC